MYSFDVYDTIVTRWVYEPKGIWELMSFYLLRDSEEWRLSASFKSDFAYIRLDAEKQARKADSYEITIDDIYKVIENNYSLSSEICERLKQLEIECELNNTVIIKENIEKIKELQKAGNHIVLISDMYLPKSFFVELFSRVCPMLNQFKLYLSCDIGITKASGLLYKYVSEQEGVPYSEWIHEGDNVVSDINVVELYGISTVFYKKSIDVGLIKRIEGVMPHNATLLRQYLLGMTKGIRADASCGYRMGYGFIGIALYAYVEWVLQQAKSRNIRRLFFIARDGFVLKKIADTVINIYALDIETFYLYGSREAWRTDEKEQKELLLEYLEQEFSGDYSSVALVDTQGTGYSIEALSRLTGHRFLIFYYAMFGSGINRDIEPVCYSSGIGGSIIEVLCRAPHGSTLGYMHEEKKIVPKLKDVNESVYRSADLFSYFDGVKDFAKEFAELSKRIGNIPLGNISEAVVSYCLNTPDREVADFLGEIPFECENGNEESVYAPKLSKDLIRKIELEDTGKHLREVYSGDALGISYLRLDMEEKEYLQECRQRFMEGTVERHSGALRVIIYGFGEWGRQLYRRMHLNPKVEVVGIVDANHLRFAGMCPTVKPIKDLRTAQYDMVVISLYDDKISGQIREMLVSAGIKNEKIMRLKEFEEAYKRFC